MTYLKQSQEIEKLAKSIIKKSKRFAKETTGSPYYDDLKSVISNLKEINNFLK